MAGSKKKIKQKEQPKGRIITQKHFPESYYHQKPSWNFSSRDENYWTLSEAMIGNLIWTELLPRLKAYETQTWNEILQISKKQNHSIDVETLSTVARKRFAEKFIESESIISLRITGTHRLYGYMIGSVFHVLWYDLEHGDNSTCVCRSHKKNT